LQGKVRKISLEAMQLLQARDHSYRDFSIHSANVATLRAHQVNVDVLTPSVVGGRTVSKMRMRHEANFFKNFERAVDSREIYSTRCLLHLGQELFGSRVLQVLNCAQDQLALWCDAIALFAKFRVPLTRHRPPPAAVVPQDD
jgi:hypothetical protein